MGFVFGLTKWLLKWSFYFALFFAIIVLIPNLPPYAQFSSIELEPTQLRVGPLAPNGELNNAKKLYKDKLLGPEAFQLFEGEVYTSLVTGELVKLTTGGHVTFVAKFGNPCSGLHEEEKCGRPLDFKIDEKEKKIYATDAYYGIWKVDIKTGKKQLLVSPRVEIDGKVPKLFNSIALDKNGDFFWTDSCTDFGLQDGSLCTMTDPSGRLLHYDAAKNTSRVLMDKLWFANGVVAAPDGRSVLVAETARYRLVRYWLAGPRQGQSEPFVQGLPGTPDNVRALPDGSGVLVALYAVFDAEQPLLLRSLAAAPLARKFLARLMLLAEAPFVFANTYFPHIIFQTAAYKIGNFASLAPLMPPWSGLVQIDWNGNIVASYYNSDSSLKGISDAIVFKDQLYLGTPYGQDFVGAVPAPELLKKAFTVKQAAPAPKAEVKPKAEPVKTQTKPTPPPPKPIEATTPKPVDKTVKPAQAKPTESKSTPKPIEAKPAPVPKAAEAKPTPKPAAAKPVDTKSTPKPADDKPVSANPVPAKPEAAKSAEAKPAPKTESQGENDKRKTKKATEGSQKKATKKTEDKPVPQQIPIVEEIPSDTAKPSRDTLKVIKKDGPTEIPNPHV